MPYFVIRHDDDEGKEKPTYKFDNKLVDGGDRHKIQKLVEKLSKRYGKPDRIFCSPMRRTRETLGIMCRHLTKGMGHKPKGGIWIDNRLSRYFTSDELGYSVAPC